MIAEPFLKDPNFLRTVVFLCEHEAEGTVGFVLNKLYEKKLGDLMSDFDDTSIPVYVGGPVQMDSIHFLHEYPDLISGGQEVMPGVYWGGNFETLSILIKTNSIDLNKVRFFIGYSGWSAGQLENELQYKSWLTVSATRKIVFHPKSGEIWKESLRLLGGEYEMMINFPIDPQLN